MDYRFRKIIYCEMQFLKELSKNINGSSTIIVSSYQETKVWQSIYNLLLNAVIELHLDISLEENVAVNHEIESSVKKNAKKGSDNTAYESILYSCYNNQKRVHLKCDHHPLSQITRCESLNPDAIYLTMLNKQDFRNLSEKKGILIISPDNIQEFIPLLNDSGLSIVKNDSGTWGQILRRCRAVPCNRITIVDNYILSKAESFEKNLKPILESLLPENAEHIFPVEIYSTLMNVSVSDRNLIPVDFYDTWKNITDIIRNIKRAYSISLCVVKYSHKNKPFHDRTIFTNNLWIGSGAGFDLFRHDDIAINSTVLNIVSPFLNDTIQWAFDAYGNLHEEAERQKRKHPDHDDLLSRDTKNLRTGMNYKRIGIITPKTT